MLVFVDESGDPGRKIAQGSSPYFIVTLVMFDKDQEALRAESEIAALRAKLGRPPDYEFHYRDATRRVKQEFFQLITRHNFSYFAIVIDKKNLRRETFHHAPTFYKFATGLVFSNAQAYLDSATVILDRTGTRGFRKQLVNYIKKRMNAPREKRIKVKKVKTQHSHENTLLQLADMISGAISESYKTTKKASPVYRLMMKQKEIRVQVWPKKKDSES